MTPAFPPDQQAGSRRWEMFAGHLKERGIALDVVASDPSQVPAPDWERVRDLPENVRAFGVLTREKTWLTAVGRGLARLGKSRLRIGIRPERGSGPEESLTRRPEELTRVPRSLGDLLKLYVVLHDYLTWRGWARDATKAATPLALKNEYDAIVTTGPPHLTHLAGRKIAEKAGVPWVMEFRDPWSLVSSIPSSSATRIHYDLAGYHERRIINRAGMVIVLTDSMGLDLAKTYPSVASRIVTVRNGSDEDPGPPPWRGRFVVCYAGEIYLDRDPRPLFRAAGLAIRRLGLRPDQFEIRLIGSVEKYGARSMKDVAQEAGVCDHLTLLRHMPRSELRAHLAEASVLVSLPQDHTHSIPAKLFDYVRYPAWLFAITDRDSEVARVFQGTLAEIFQRDDVEGMARALEVHYAEFVAGLIPSPADVEGALTRKVQAEYLVEQLTERVFLN